MPSARPEVGPYPPITNPSIDPAMELLGEIAGYRSQGIRSGDDKRTAR